MRRSISMPRANSTRPGGGRVEPMHDERVRLHRLHTRLQAVLAVLAAGGHGEQAGGLVDDEEVVVEVEDGGCEGGHGEARS